MASSVTTATVTATPNDENATVTYSFTDADTATEGRQINLSPGLNRVTITVAAEDGMAVLEYTINIARGVDHSYGWKAVDDFDGLIAAGNLAPFGIWGNSTSFYVADDFRNHIYVYNRDGTRDTSKEIEPDSGDFHYNLNGIWSDGTTLWAVDYADINPRMFAYRLSDGTRDEDKEFNLDPMNTSAVDIWSDNATMWVLDTLQRRVFAYRLSDGVREESKDFSVAELFFPKGLWSDGVTIWVTDVIRFDLFAWDLETGMRDQDRDFRIPAELNLFNSSALWSDDTTMWAADANQSKVLSFNVPPQTRMSFDASAYTVREGDTVTVTATLDPDPKREVTIPLSSTHLMNATPDDYSGVPESLVFASGETTKSFIFSATDDLLDDDDESVRVALSTTPYRVMHGTPAEITFIIEDNDDPPMLVLNRTSLTVQEDELRDASYTVKLATQPDEDVTGTVTGQAGTDLTLTGLSAANTLTFTTTNWSTAQTVPVKAIHDTDGADDSVTLTHTASGGNYADVSAGLAVMVTDDEEMVPEQTRRVSITRTNTERRMS